MSISLQQQPAVTCPNDTLSLASDTRRTVSGTGYSVSLVRHRRRMRFIRFVVSESIAVFLMISSISIGVTHQPAVELHSAIYRMAPVLMALVVGVIPILFYGNSRCRLRR